MKIKQVNFSKGGGLVPTIIQDVKTKEALMLGYMNEKALVLTWKTKWVHFWSRSRSKIWLKGETSGNKLKVVRIISDCDNDTLLVEVDLVGKSICHTGSRSCFLNEIFLTK